MIGQFNPIRFPNTLHIRVDDEMAAEIKARGGGPWVRALIAANARPPVQAAGEFAGANPGEGPKPARSRRSTVKRRVSLDSRSSRRVSSRVSRKA